MKRILTIAASLCIICSASAQEAFKSLGLGLEVGTTGAGVELALPVVSDHLVLKAGFNAPTISYSHPGSLDPSQVNDNISSVNAELASYGVPERINTTFSPIEYKISSMLNLSTAKLMLEWYPFKKASFHITVGAYYGLSSSFISARAESSEAFCSQYKQLGAEIEAINAKYQGLSGYSPVSLEELRFGVDDRDFAILEDKARMLVSMDLAVAKIRPYFGIGFGRSIPKSHFSVMFDLGAWYHGAPVFSSPNQLQNSASEPIQDIETGYDIWEILPKAAFYPQLSLRLSYKIF